SQMYVGPFAVFIGKSRSSSGLGADFELAILCRMSICAQVVGLLPSSDHVSGSEYSKSGKPSQS
ncbi:MAG: hypothetical protein ACRCWF_15950, partial [Beijerinckiaceae bacterium]